MYLSDACTLPVNMAGLPGISIPCGLSEGLPVGLQFIGAPWSEASLFGLSRGYEAITAERRGGRWSRRTSRRHDRRPDSADACSLAAAGLRRRPPGRRRDSSAVGRRS